MKKQHFLAMALLLSAVSFAQTPVSFGIRGGVTSAGLRGDAVANLGSLIDLSNNMLTTSNNTGFFAGTYATIPLSKGISIEPGLYYAQKGYSLKGNLAVKAASFLGVNARTDLNSHYIDLPVVVKASIGPLQVFAGPQISYLAKANFKTTAGVLGLNLLHKNFEVTEQFNRWDGSLTGGVAYQFANGLNITAAYDHGLSRVDASKRLNSYTQAVKVGVGFRL